jgi:hypothetical protein
MTRMEKKNQQFRAFEVDGAKALLKVFVPSIAAAAVLFAASAARAQGRFGEAGQMAITAENLFGVSSQTVTRRDQPVGGGPGPGVLLADESDTSTRFGFLFASHQDGTPPSGLRLGVHYFVIPSLSLGGTVGFESRGGSASRPDPQTGAVISRNRQSDTSVVVLPKVGYALMLSDALGFWFRGGLGYANDTIHPDPVESAHTAYSFWLVSADALFVVAPLPNFGFYVGPTADLSFSGTYSATANNGVTTSYSASYTRVGLDTGLIGYFGL